MARPRTAAKAAPAPAAPTKTTKTASKPASKTAAAAPAAKASKTSAAAKPTKTKTASAAATKTKAAPTKTKRAKKDPNAPKRAASSYILFSNAMRAKVLEENKGIAFTEVAKVIGQKWRDLSPAEKAKYENLAAEDKKRADKEKAAFKAV